MTTMAGGEVEAEEELQTGHERERKELEGQGDSYSLL